MGSMSRSIACVALCVAAAAGCTRALPDGFTCTVSSQCVFEGRQGTCEPTGGCSFADDSCASGRRYGDLGPGGLAGQCVVVDTDLGTVVWPPDAGAADLATPMAGMITRVGSSKIAPGPPGNGGAIVLPVPSGVAPGDLLLATVYANDQASTIAAPAGWTMQADVAAGNFHGAWFYRFVAAGDQSITAFIATGSPTKVAAAIVAYRGVDATAPIDASMSRQFIAMSYIAPSITTTRANDMLVAMFVDQTQGTGLSTPAGMAIAVDDTAIVVFDETQPLAGATGAKTAGSFPGVGAVDFVALAPAP